MDKLSIIFSRTGWTTIKIIVFFHLVIIGWLFFRANSLQQAIDMLVGLLWHLEWAPDLRLVFLGQQLVFFTSLLLVVQWFQYKNNDLMVVYRAHPFIRFIYFQF